MGTVVAPVQSYPRQRVMDALTDELLKVAKSEASVRGIALPPDRPAIKHPDPKGTPAPISRSLPGARSLERGRMMIATMSVMILGEEGVGLALLIAASLAALYFGRVYGPES